MSRLLTWVLRLLPLLGVALVIVGSQEWYPESWLDSKGFVINLASGFTAACFGLPVAYFVVQKLVIDRERRSIAQNTADRAFQVAMRIRRVVRESLPVVRIEHVASKVNVIDRAIKEFYDIAGTDRPLSNAEGGLYRLEWAWMQIHHNLWELYECGALNIRRDTQPAAIAEARTMSEYLRLEVNLSLTRHGLRPISTDAVKIVCDFVHSDWSSTPYKDAEKWLTSNRAKFEALIARKVPEGRHPEWARNDLMKMATPDLAREVVQSADELHVVLDALKPAVESCGRSYRN